MLPLGLPADRPQRILCLGAHSDDIEIGCGATLLHLAETVPGLEVRWVVFSGDERRTIEAKASAAEFLAGVPRQEVAALGFRESFFPAQWSEIKAAMEAQKPFKPTLILTHTREDHHQDHRIVSELTWNTFRDHLLLEYEIPKYEGDIGNPNLFVPVSRDNATRKAEAIRRHFVSQHGRSWFSEETFMATMRLRGIGCNAPSGLAEAFTCRKVVIQ